MYNKPLGKKAYGSIPHLPGSRLGPGDYHISDGQAAIATQKPRDKHDFIVVQEKLDGSNVAVAKINGAIVALTRAGYEVHTSPFVQHHYFGRWVALQQSRFEALLQEGERLCGEWLAMAHGTRYQLPHEPFVAFDLITGTTRVPYLRFAERVQQHGFVVPHLLHAGPNSFSVAAMLQSLGQGGHGALDPVEGAIWRVERMGKVDFLCKYVHHSKVDGKYFPEQTGGTEVWNWEITEWQPDK